MNPNLRVFIDDEERIFTSFTASSLPAVIPPMHRPFNRETERDSSTDDIKDALTTQWAYESRPWFALIPVQPVFDGPIFGRLNHTFYSIPIESTSDGRYILRSDVRGSWGSLEEKLIWCKTRLGVNMLCPWYFDAPRNPRDYGYMRSHINAKLARKVALRSRDAFLGIAALCTYFIMTQKSVGKSWTAVLIADPQRPIPPTWVDELSRTFVGDLTGATPRTGVIINGADGPSWNQLAFIFERFEVPIWIHCPNVALGKDWRRYLPSAEDITTARGQRWGVQSNDNPWGVELDGNPWITSSTDDNACGAHDSWPDADPWGNQSTDQQPVSNIQLQPDLSCFPLPRPHSRQKQGEDWKAFFARRAERNKELEAVESPSHQQARLARERHAMNHKIPSSRSTTWVFEWQPQDDYNGFLLRTHITKANVEDIWGNYNKSTRIYDSFNNQWDLCAALDPISIPDGDWREDIDDLDDPPLPTSDVPPPPLSSFSQDIYTYFGNDVSLASRHADIEGIAPVLHYHFGYRLDGPPSVVRYGSILLDQWINKTTWDHLRKLIGDSAIETGLIAEPQRRRITSFIAYLVNLRQSELDTIPPDLWDLGPHPSLPVAHAQIRVSYAELSQQRFFVVEHLHSPSLAIWTLAVPDALTAVMCLRRDWSSVTDIKQVALALLKRGMAFRTLQKMAVGPNFRRPLTELQTYTLGHHPPSFQATYADYIVYEQRRHEFMNQPRARAALLHGGLVWRLALHSLGHDNLAPVLVGLSPEAAASGLVLYGNGQSYYDDELSEEEIDFMCGTYYIDHNGNVEMTSWWPRPSAWNGSGLNVGFWSARCEDWFQTRLTNIRDGVSRTRHSSTTDGNGPMTASQWKRSIKFNSGTSKMMNNVSAACYDFMMRVPGKIN